VFGGIAPNRRVSSPNCEVFLQSSGLRSRHRNLLRRIDQRAGRDTEESNSNVHIWGKTGINVNLTHLEPHVSDRWVPHGSSARLEAKWIATPFL
jgi:hypothetical protein